MKTQLIISITVFALLFSSCDKMFLGDQEENDPVNNFNYVWNDVNETYGPFCVKNIDWEEIYHIYSANLNENSTDAELY